MFVILGLIVAYCPIDIDPRLELYFCAEKKRNEF